MACVGHTHVGTVDAVVSIKDLVHTKATDCTPENTAGKKHHSIGGAGVCYDGEVPGDNHEPLNTIVHNEIRVVTLTAHSPECTPSSYGESKHTDRTECIPHNGATLGTSTDGGRPPHLNLPLSDGKHKPNVDGNIIC